MDTTAITKDTTLCVSLSARPSNVGTRFHNYLYAELGLDFVYKAFACDDLPGAVAGIRAMRIRGASLSMPFKETVLGLLDSVDGSARAIGAVNTVVNTDDHLRGFNTDYQAVAGLLRSYEVPSDAPFVVVGSGGMARAVLAALRDSGFADGSVVSRNERTGTALASDFGYPWRAEARSERPRLLVNATPVGMAGGPAADGLPVAVEVVDAAKAVLEVVAMPPETPLVRRAKERGIPVITGPEVQTLQAVEQFVHYTGVRPNDDQVALAAAFSRSG